MTAQTHDKIIFKGDVFDLVAHNGEGLLTPQDFDLHPGMWSTACTRGYISTHTVDKNGDLNLTALFIGRLTRDVEWKPISGISAEPVYREGWTFKTDEPDERIKVRYEDGRTYMDLREPTTFSGGLVVAKGFIKKLYIHAGFAKPYQYVQVNELIFQDGKLVDVIDQSEKARQWRERYLRAREISSKRLKEFRSQGLSAYEIVKHMRKERNREKDIKPRFSLDYKSWF